MLANRMLMSASDRGGSASPATIEYAGYASTAFGSSVSLTNVTIGTASADRVVFCIVGIKPGGTYRSLSSATIGGISATIHGQTDDTTYKYNVALISAAVPTGTTATVSLTFSGSGSGDVYVASYVATGLLSADPVGIVENKWTYAQGAVSLSSSIAATADGIALFGACCSLASSGLSLDGVTEDFEQIIDTNIRFIGGHIAIDASDLSYGVSVSSDNGTTKHFDRQLAASFR